MVFASVMGTSGVRSRSRLLVEAARAGLLVAVLASEMGCLSLREEGTPQVNPPSASTPPSTSPRPGTNTPDASPPDGPPKPECVAGSTVSTEICAAGLACVDSKCVACVTGEACTPEDSCHKGTLDCTAGVKCVDTGTNVEAGKSCGTNKVCSAAGKCDACTVGESCKPTDLCKTGKIECSTGAPVCAPSGDAPNGGMCGEGQVCSAGACVACQNGMSCVPTNKCHTGTLSCSTGTPQCMDSGSNAPNGMTCGDAQVCRDGECVGCMDKMPCVPTDNPCKVGAISCTTGSPVCVATTTNAMDGKECGAEMACRGGQCRVCRTTGSCSNNSCKESTYQCNAGMETCRETNRPNGTACPGGENACLNGSCQRCRNSGECDDNPCSTSNFQCEGGRESCERTGNVRDGTRACGNNRACRGGSCQQCRDSGECTPDDNDDARCKVGDLQCDGNGREQCVPTSTNRPPAFRCANGRVCASRNGLSTNDRTCRAPLDDGDVCETPGRKGPECRVGYCTKQGASGEGDRCEACGGNFQDCCPDGGNNGCDSGLTCNSSDACESVAPPPVMP